MSDTYHNSFKTLFTSEVLQIIIGLDCSYNSHRSVIRGANIVNYTITFF